MRGLNKVTLIGNLGGNPEIQKLQGDVNVAKFSLATTESFKDAKGQFHSTTVPGARWSRTLKSWYVSDIPANRRLLGLTIDPVGKEVLSHIHPVNQGALQLLIETLQLKAYSESTIRTYRNEFAQLLYVLKATAVDIPGHRAASQLFPVLYYYPETIREHAA